MKGNDLLTFSVQPEDKIGDLRARIQSQTSSIADLPIRHQEGDAVANRTDEPPVLRLDRDPFLRLSDQVFLVQCGIRDGDAITTYYPTPYDMQLCQAHQCPPSLSTLMESLVIALPNTVSGDKKLTVHVWPNDRVCDLKLELLSIFGHPVSKQQLWHRGRELEDLRTLKEQGLVDESTVQLRLRTE